MSLNRIRQFVEETSRCTTPSFAAAAPVAGFAVWPVGLVQQPWQEEVYRAAYERAQESVRRAERQPFRLFWN